MFGIIVVPRYIVVIEKCEQFTTNHKTDGIYLPSDDRRHYVAWSDRHEEDFADGYWKDLWHWYENGYAHVAAYLSGVDISDFDPKAPPPKTQAFWDIVNVGQAPGGVNFTERVLQLAL